MGHTETEDERDARLRKAREERERLEAMGHAERKRETRRMQAEQKTMDMRAHQQHQGRLLIIRLARAKLNAMQDMNNSILFASECNAQTFRVISRARETGYSFCPTATVVREKNSIPPGL